MSGLTIAEMEALPVGTLLRRTGPRDRNGYLIDHGYVHGVEDEKVLVATRAYGCAVTFRELATTGFSDFIAIYIPEEDDNADPVPD